MSELSTLDKIASNQDKYSCKVETLGECKIVSPVHHHEFINDGERIAQLVIAAYEQAEFEAVESLDQTERGEGGFGHTGKA